MKKIFTIYHYIIEGQGAGRSWLYLMQRLQLRILSLTRIRDRLVNDDELINQLFHTNQY